MKYLFILLSVLVIGCSKGEKALESGTWNLDSYSYSGRTVTPSNTTVQFSNGKMTIKVGDRPYIYNYDAGNKVITVNGTSASYIASKKSLKVGMVLYPLYDTSDPLEIGESNLSH